MVYIGGIIIYNGGFRKDLKKYLLGTYFKTVQQKIIQCGILLYLKQAKIHFREIIAIIITTISHHCVENQIISESEKRPDRGGEMLRLDPGDSHQP